jgi:uncharacterized protein YdaU (DUF1376 family)
VNYYKHHIGDYKAATAHLTLIEHGAYRQLLDMYYLDEKPIPLETQVVFRRLCARTQEEQTAVETVLREFFEETKNGWMHKRCESELSQYSAKADANRENGKRGGRPKKTHMVSEANPHESEVEPKITLTTNQEPLTTNQEPKEKGTRSSSASASRFDARKWLTDRGVEDQHITDWFAARAKKNLANTLTAFERTVKEAQKAGVSLKEAVEYCAGRGFGGFNADMIQGKQGGQQSTFDLAAQVQRNAGPRNTGGYVSKQEQLERNNRAVVERFAARLQAEEAAKGNDHENEE